MKWNDRLYFCQVDVFPKSAVKWIVDGFSGLILSPPGLTQSGVGESWNRCWLRVCGAAPGLGAGSSYILGNGRGPQTPFYSLQRWDGVGASHLGFAVLRLGVVRCSICSHRLIGPKEVLSQQSCTEPGINCGILYLSPFCGFSHKSLFQMFDLSSVACKGNMYVTSYEREAIPQPLSSWSIFSKFVQ